MTTVSIPTKLNSLEITDNFLSVNFEDLHYSYLNSLRRILLQDIKTYGFLREDISIQTNTTYLNNQFTSHRISMLPIYNPKGVRLQDYDFIIDIQNNTNDILEITTDDFIIRHKTNGTQLNNQEIFPHDPITNDPIIITRMNPARFQESIKLSATPIIGTPRQNHAGFQVTSQVSYTYIQDPDKVEAEFQRIVNSQETPPSDEEVEKMRREFMTLDAKRQFYTNENGEPNKFNFRIEAIGPVPVQNIIPIGCDALIERFTNLEIEAAKTDSEIIQYSSSSKHKDAIIIKLNHEDDTIANIVRHYIYSHFVSNPANDMISYVGYRRPHYLKDYIVIKMIVKDGNLEYGKTAFNNSLRELKKFYQDIRDKYVSLLN